MSDILYDVKNLKRYFPAKRGIVKAVDDVTFQIARGETFSLVGESGCGKTTCGRTLLGIYPRTSGTILYKGKDMSKLDRREQKNFKRFNQMIFQDPYSCLDPRMTIGTIIEEGMKVHFDHTAAEREDIVRGLLYKVGLTPDFASRFPHELSGGQRQRIGIARALSVDPEFLFCDEPISALDVSIQAQIINLLVKLQKERDLTMLFIAHDLSMVKHISDRIAVMYLGNMIETSDSNELYKKPLHPYTEALLSAVPVADPRVSRQREKIMLSGDVPSPIDPPPGCRFSGRCSKCMDLCMKERPVLREIEPGHHVACHLYD